MVLLQNPRGLCSGLPAEASHKLHKASFSQNDPSDTHTHTHTHTHTYTHKSTKIQLNIKVGKIYKWSINAQPHELSEKFKLISQ